MVDLVKIRKKLKEKADALAAEARASATGPDSGQSQASNAADSSADSSDDQAGRARPVRGRASSSPASPGEAALPELSEIAATPIQTPEPQPAPPDDVRPSKLQRFLETAGKRRANDQRRTHESSADQFELLTFAIAGEQYAIDIESVVEIVPPRSVTRVPNADRSIGGILSLRGTIVTLIDVRMRLKHPSMGDTADTRIIVVQQGEDSVGFSVDRVLRVVKIDRAALQPHPVVHASEQDESVLGVFRHADALTILLDLEKLLGRSVVASAP